MCGELLRTEGVWFCGSTHAEWMDAYMDGRTQCLFACLSVCLMDSGGVWCLTTCVCVCSPTGPGAADRGCAGQVAPHHGPSWYQELCLPAGQPASPPPAHALQCIAHSSHSPPTHTRHCPLVIERQRKLFCFAAIITGASYDGSLELWP